MVESLEVGIGQKTLYSCQFCGKASIKRRKRVLPVFRCHNQECKGQFNDPITETVQVTTFRIRHDAGWVSLDGLLDGNELRALCRDHGSQHAIRPLVWEHFQAAVSVMGATLRQVDRRSDDVDGAAPRGGHVIATTRVRRGEDRFRERLLSEFGERCAVTGPCPRSVLEAGHLYSYAQSGVHHKHGGLLLRRDVHSLFDRGALAIHPDSLTVSVGSNLAGYPTYEALEGQGLQVLAGLQHRRWFRSHWAQHRGDLRL